MKKYILILLIIGLICFTSCTNENVNLNGVGLNELMKVDIPNAYKEEKNPVYSETGELISKHYGNDRTSIYFMILSYKGKAVMGSDETIDEWYKTKDNIVDTYSIDKADSKMYIYPISLNKRSKNADGSIIEGVFGYHDYVIMIGMETHEGVGSLTKNEIKTFYDMLKTIKLQ